MTDETNKFHLCKIPLSTFNIMSDIAESLSLTADEVVIKACEEFSQYHKKKQKVIELQRLSDPMYIEKCKKRLYKKITKLPNGCWEYTGSLTTNGYGNFRFNDSNTTAHKFSYIAHKGYVPEGFIVRHRCHNKRCVNPEHLVLGSQKQNIKDTNLAGTAQRQKGINHCQAKLMDADVAEIRNLYDTSKAGISELADRYRVSETTIRNIVHKITWKHLL